MDGRFCGSNTNVELLEAFRREHQYGTVHLSSSLRWRLTSSIGTTMRCRLPTMKKRRREESKKKKARRKRKVRRRKKTK